MIKSFDLGLEQKTIILMNIYIPSIWNFWNDFVKHPTLDLDQAE